MLVPKLRFKNFIDEWAVLNIKESFQYYSTNSFSRENMDDKGSIKNIHYGDIHRKYENILDLENIRVPHLKDDVNYKNITLCRDGDIIFADASEDYVGIGKAIEIINIKTDHVVCGLHTIHARDISNKFAMGFKGYLFNSPTIHNQIRIVANGFKVFGISKNTINSLIVHIPSISEQSKIVKLLSLLDKKIQLQQEKIDALKLYKKGLFQNILNLIKDSDYQSLESVSSFQNGKGHENGIDKNGEYIVINSKFISSEGKVVKYCNEQLSPLYTNDIVMVMSDVPKGKAIAKCFYIDENKKYTLNQRICRITANTGVDSKFLFYIINRNPYFLRFDDSVNQTNLRKDDILNIEIPIPEYAMQIQISNLLSCIDNKLSKNIQFIQCLKELKKGLVQNMFV